MVAGSKLTQEQLDGRFGTTTVKSLTNDTRDPEKGSGVAIFVNYVTFITGSGRTLVSEPPAKKANGKTYMQTIEVTMRDIVPSDKFEKVDDHTYNVLARIRYHKGKEDVVKAFIMEHKIAPFYDAETGGVIETTFVKVLKNSSYDITLMTYSEAEYNAFVKKDKTTKKMKFSTGDTVKLSGLVPQMTLTTYTKKSTGDEEEQLPQFKAEFGFLMDGITCLSYNTDANTKSLAGTYHNIYEKNQCELPDMRDVISGAVDMPQNTYLWFDSNDNSYFVSNDCALIRRMEPSSEKKDFLRNFDKDDLPTKIQAKMFCTDSYENLGKRIANEVMIFEEQCKNTGLDTEDYDIWADLLLAHPLSAHIVANIQDRGKYGTRQVGSNTPGELERRGPDTDPNVTHATYKWVAKQWVVDWEKTLANRGIEIDKKTFLDTFKNANKKLGKNDKMFKVSTDAETGESELVFKSVLPYDNFIAKDGVSSKVIPFGSGARPTFECGDATAVIESKTTRFYALTGVTKVDCADWSTVKQGSSVFKDQLKSIPDLSYSLFAIQNCEPRGKKKK